jgi:hypothetical protein
VGNTGEHAAEDGRDVFGLAGEVAAWRRELRSLVGAHFATPAPTSADRWTGLSACIPGCNARADFSLEAGKSRLLARALNAHLCATSIVWARDDVGRPCSATKPNKLRFRVIRYFLYRWL